MAGQSKETIFAHTSDWHLGNEQYHKFERARDFSRAVKSFMKQILQANKKPDFILHSGDVFHHFRPSSMALKTAIEVFTTFQKNKIPVYVIRGNHDAPISRARAKHGNYLSLLEELGIITYLDQRNPIVWHSKDVAILGICYFGKQTTKMLKKTMEEYSKDLEDASFKILMLHALMKGQLPQEYDLTPEEIAPFRFDYVALGHYHIPWKLENHRMWCPGSTEHTSSNQWDEERTKNGICQYGSWLSIKASYGSDYKSIIKPELRLIEVRPKIRIDRRIHANSNHELTRKIRDVIRAKRIPGAVYSIRIRVQSPPEGFSSLSVAQFHEDLADALHSTMKIEFVMQGERPIYHVDESKYLREFASSRFADADLEMGMKIIDHVMELADSEEKIQPEDREKIFLELFNHAFQKNGLNPSFFQKDHEKEVQTETMEGE